MRITNDLKIGRNLSDAHMHVFNEMPVDPEPVIVLAAYLHCLVDGYGLTESQHLDPMALERAELPEMARDFVNHFIPGSSNDDLLRAGLYEAFAALADDLSARNALDGSRAITPEEFLLVAQVGWNLEANSVRVRLPLGSGEVSGADRTIAADMKVPGANLDFATMNWTSRRNQKVDFPRKSAGDSFGRQVARLAVLTAKWMVNANPRLPPGLKGARIVAPVDNGPRFITWDQEAQLRRPVEESHESLPAVNHCVNGKRVLVGSFAAVGRRYQLRGFDNELEQLWADGGDRRVWLLGGPGLGKSFAARRVMQEALESVGDERETLLIWVDSANADTVAREFARAAEQIGMETVVDTSAPDRVLRLARRLLEHLTTTDARWLVVLDNAESDELIKSHLIPPGTNPRGRVLITTVNGSHLIEGAGRQVRAEEFSPAEAESYLAAWLPTEPPADRSVLSERLGRHPLALSIAASTAVAEGMKISDWLAEFEATDSMDLAADHSDAGGYPSLIGATWRLALDRAAKGLPEGTVERAAMVASLQDPDGHPSWLWRRGGAVTEWVAAGEPLPIRDGRIHPAIKRLVDFGILRVDGNWLEGTVAIHQLAARAVRELADPGTLAPIAAILADEWLLQITQNPARAQPRDVRAGIRIIAEAPGIESATIDTALVLLHFSKPDLSKHYDWDRVNLGRMEPILLGGGVTGRAELARGRTELGYAERDQDRSDDAGQSWAEAASLYEQCLQDPTIEGEYRAELLTALAEVEDELGQLEQARLHREQSIRLLEQAQTSTSKPGRELSKHIALTDLHRRQMNDAKSGAALERALAMRVQVRFHDDISEAGSLTDLGRRLRERGRLEEALDFFQRAAELYSRTYRRRSIYRKNVGEDLAITYAAMGRWSDAEYAELGRWSDAEEWLEDGAAAARIASVQLHQGHVDKARTSIRKSSEAIREMARIGKRVVQPSTCRLLDQAREEHGRNRINLSVAKALVNGRVDDATGLACRLLDAECAASIADPDFESDRLSAAYRVAAGVSGDVNVNAKHVSLRELHAQLQPQDVNAQKEYGESLVLMAKAEEKAGALQSAVNSARRAVDIFELNSIDLTNPGLQIALRTLVDAHAQLGNVEEAMSWSFRRVTIWQAAMAKSPSDQDVQLSLAEAYQVLVSVQLAAQLWEEAARTTGKILDIRRSLDQIDSGVPESQSKLAEALLNHAFFHEKLGRFHQSLSFIEEAVDVRHRRVDRDPTDPLLHSELAHSLMSLYLIHNELGEDGAAVEALSRAVDYLQLPTELDPNTHKPLQLQGLGGLGSGLRQLGRIAEADAADARADELNRRFPDS